MSEGNAYTKLIKMMRKQGYNKDIETIVGSVKSVEPLKVQINGILLEEEDMSISYALKEYTRKITIPSVVTEQEATFHSPLTIGDNVLILMDNDNFYVIDKVV